MPEQATSFTTILEQILVDFMTMLPKLIAALVVFAVGLYLASLIKRLVSRRLQRRTENPQPVSLISQVTYWLVVVVVATISLQMVGFNLTAFLAGLGIAGFTIGFALQDVSKNFIAGLLMMLQQPFEIGDTIEVLDFTGKVLEIDLRSTRLHTLDGRLVLLPNGEVMTSAITNYTQSKIRRVEISTGVAYESDPELVRKTALEALAGVNGLISEPLPEVVFQNFGNPAIELTIYFWVDNSKTTIVKAKDEGLNTIRAAFDQAQIDMPLPAQTIYLLQ